MLSSEKTSVLLAKSGFILPESIGERFSQEDHKRVLLIASANDKEVRIHVALRKIKGVYQVYFGKQHQKSLGISIGDPFEIKIYEDTSTYGVEVPESLQAVMDSDPDGFSIFENLTDGKKRGIIYFIRRIKNEQTQVDKSLTIFENLKRGFREHKDLIKVL